MAKPTGIVYAKNEYTIPRGRVFFNPIVEDAMTGAESFAGEIYMGNCPSFSISIETEKAEHYSSETGLRQKDASVLLEVKRSGSITCDNMSADNVALFISGKVSMHDQSADAVGSDATIKDIITGRTYQLGQTPQNPRGHQKVELVSIVKYVDGSSGDIPLSDGSGNGGADEPDFVLDAATGRLQLLAGGEASLTGGETIVITYKRAAVKWRRITSGSTGELTGALRVISDNATGSNRDFYMPRVSLVPSGELPVIAEGTDFAQMQFDADVLKPANGEAIYVDGVPIAA